MFVLYNLKWVQNFLLNTPLDSVLRLLDQLTFRACAAAIMSFAFVLIFGRPVIRWLTAKKIGDAGKTDVVALEAVAGSKRHVPTMGGVLIVGATVFSTLLLSDFISNNYVILGLVTLLWMSAIGGVDDWLKLTAATRSGGSRQGLFAWEKLVAQLGGALLIAFFAYRYGMLPDSAAAGQSLSHVLNLPLQKTYVASVNESAGTLSWVVNSGLIYLPMWVFVPLGVMMIAGMSNAVNIADGMDGLAAGTSTAVSIGLMLLALIAGTQSWANWLLVPYVADSGELAVMAGAMGGACLGFLWFNCSPASVFMGDTGALGIGGVIGYVAMVTRQEIVVLFMCGVFLIEIGSVVLQVGYFKLSGGKRIFKVAPFHHHLHLSDWREQQVVVRFWIITLLLVVIGLASIKVR